MEFEIVDLQSWFKAGLERMCARADPPLTAREVSNRHRKTKPIAAMRAQFAFEMQRSTGQRGRGTTRKYVYFPDGRPNDWEPISTPVLAEFLNLHHSTIVLALQKLAKLEAAEAAKAEGGVETIGTVAVDLPAAQVCD